MNSTVALPATLPIDSTARLPATYEAARTAIAECSRVDECKGWSDRAAALASYAKQAKDDSLRVMAVRIQARAVRRCGELLKQVPRGDLSTRYGQEGDHPPVITRTQVADDAGLSEHQRKTALRVATVPTEDFDYAVESQEPPTVTKLAALGTQDRPVCIGASDSSLMANPAQAMAAAELLRKFAESCENIDAVQIAHAMPPGSVKLVRQQVSVIDRWLDSLVTNLAATVDFAKTQPKQTRRRA
jgi:hypothetical protein